MPPASAWRNNVLTRHAPAVDVYATQTVTVNIMTILFRLVRDTLIVLHQNQQRHPRQPRPRPRQRLPLRRRRLRQRQSAQSAQLCKIARTPFNVLTHRASTVCASTRRTTHIVPRPAFANHIIATAAVVCQARMPLFARLKGKDLCAADLEQWIATASTSLRISTIATVVDSSVQPIAHHAKAELVFVRRHRRPQPRPRQPRPRQRLLLQLVAVRVCSISLQIYAQRVSLQPRLIVRFCVLNKLPISFTLASLIGPKARIAVIYQLVNRALSYLKVFRTRFRAQQLPAQPLERRLERQRQRQRPLLQLLRRPLPRPRQRLPLRQLLRQPDAATAQLAALDASQTCSNPIAMTLPFAMQSACSQLAPAVVQRHQRHLVRRHLVQRHLVQPLHRIAVVRARSSVLM